MDLRILQAAQVVGMTTSGVAEKQTLIAALAPKVSQMPGALDVCAAMMPISAQEVLWAAGGAGGGSS